MEQPTIKIELGMMKQTIIHALAKYTDELQALVQAEIDKQIESFDLEKYIRDEVESLLHRMIDSSIRSELQWAVNSEISEGVRRMLAQKLATPQSKETEE